MAECCSSVSTSGHAYSPLWFHTFLQDVDPAITNREVAFVQRRMPPASHVERRTMRGDRLHLSLRYEDASDGRQVGSDDFEWRLYAPRELTAEAHRLGLMLKLSCSEFDETSAARGDVPRMQLVFSR